jgi:ferredoxin-NADP reductase
MDPNLSLPAVEAPMAPLRRSAHRGWRALGRHLLLDRHARFWLRELDPTLAPEAIRARVLRVIDETPDVKTFVLAPNHNWRPHRPGQHTLVEVRIDGVRHQRCYSISSPPSAQHVAITVKRVPGGLVSNFLHDHVGTGDVIGLSGASGDFVLPEASTRSMLLLSGGSGITPTLAMLEVLFEEGRAVDLVFVHFARSRADVIAGARLTELAERAGFRLIICTDDDAGPPGFEASRFAALVPDFAERETFLCGPPGLMTRVEAMWAEAGVSERLHQERFTAPMAAPRDAAAPVTVTLSRSGRAVVAEGAGSLLEQLERAGEKPKSGCRMGICHTCRCRKVQGTVQNLVTGELSSEPDELIRLCISAPRTDLELGL